MNKNKVLLLLITLLFAGTSFAQKGDYTPEKGANWTDRVYFGGGFGLSGGGGYGMISISPMVGYMITPKLSGGVGATYQYYKSGDFSDNRYGGNLFLRMNTFRNIFLYGSYEFFNYSVYPYDGDRYTATRLPLGLGISQPIGPRSSINLLAAYDVLWDERAYNSPWVFSIFFSI